ELTGKRCRCSENDSVERLVGASMHYAPTVVFKAKLLNCGIWPKGSRLQRGHNGFREFLHPVFEGCENRRLRLIRGFLSRRQHGFAEAAIIGLHFSETRKNRSDAQVSSFSAIDSGEQRVGEAVDHFLSVVAFYQ